MTKSWLCAFLLAIHLFNNRNVAVSLCFVLIGRSAKYDNIVHKFRLNFNANLQKNGDWPTGEEFGRNSEGIAHCENACAYILHVPKFHN